MPAKKVQAKTTKSPDKKATGKAAKKTAPKGAKKPGSAKKNAPKSPPKKPPRAPEKNRDAPVEPLVEPPVEVEPDLVLDRELPAIDVSKTKKASRKKIAQEPGPETPDLLDLYEPGVLEALFADYEDEAFIKQNISAHVSRIISSHGMNRYTVLLLFHEQRSIRRWQSNRLHEAAQAAEAKKDILCLLHSSGGQIEPAYLMGRMLGKLSKKRFLAVVPRRAKSAATLIALGADQIHMGVMSELGPIDPQIVGYPSSWLANVVKVLGEVAEAFPQSADMLARFLKESVTVKSLGYIGRAGQSAARYAEKLLNGKKFPKPHTAKSLAARFVDGYNDHGFVIDSDEAQALLGKNMVRVDTPPYRMAREIHDFLEQVEGLLSLHRDQILEYAGNPAEGLFFHNKG